jgi:drug/metabolite transporter (DMT)-like permease
MAASSAGVAAAALATMFYGLAVVMQKSQAERVGAGGVRILGALARRPRWLLAVGIQMIGLAFHSFALTRAPVALVQPIIASGVAFVVLFAFLLLDERPTRREMTGTALLIGGLALLVQELRGSAAIQDVVPQDLGLALGSCVALIAVLTGSGRYLGVGSGLAAVALAGAAGLGQGMSDAMNRLVGAWLVPTRGWVPPAPMAIAAVLLLVAFGLQGLATAQNALRVYRANTVVPCLVAAQLLVPIAMAQVVYGQDVRVVSPWALAVASFGTFSGLLILCTSSRVTSSIARPG